MDSQQFSRRWFVAVVMTVAIGFSSTAGAAETNAATTITTKKMCPVCAKKITDSLRKIEGVNEVRVDVPSKTFMVDAARDRTLSPRALWETVQRGGEQPVRLSGPSGTFTEKPKF
jgi:copper chaperone CopZ